MTGGASRLLDWDGLVRKGPTWAHLLVCPESEVDNLVWQRRGGEGGVIARILMGNRCTFGSNLFHEFAAALQFPYYFGWNWSG